MEAPVIDAGRSPRRQLSGDVPVRLSCQRDRYSRSKRRTARDWPAPAKGGAIFSRESFVPPQRSR